MRSRVLPSNSDFDFDRTSSTPAPNAPTLNSVTAGNQQNTVSWSSVSGASNYNVYFNTTGSVTTSDTKITAGNTTSIVHSGLVNGTTYYYRVSAEGLGGESALSNELFGTPNVGAFGNAFSTQFNGIDEYAQVPVGDDFSFVRVDEFSVSYWIKANNLGDFSILGNLDNSNSLKGWSTYLTVSGNLGFTLEANSLITAETNNTIFSSTWYHVCFVKEPDADVSSLKIYLNSIDQSLSTTGGTLAGQMSSNAPLVLARRSDATRYYDGLIDEPAIYNKALSQSEVSEIYNSGQPEDLTSLSTSANIISWWRMGDDPNDNASIGIFDQVASNNFSTVNQPVFVGDTP